MLWSLDLHLRPENAGFSHWFILLGYCFILWLLTSDSNVHLGALVRESPERLGAGAGDISPSPEPGDRCGARGGG